MDENNLNSNNIDDFNKNNELIELNLDNIREYIEILKNYLNECVEKDDMLKATEVKNKIELFKNLEKNKIKEIKENLNKEQRDKFESEFQTEISNKETIFKNNYEQLNKDLEEQENSLINKHQNEIKNFENKFKTEYLEKIKQKPGKETLNWIKIKKYAIKQKNFKKAEEAKNNIKNFKKIDNKRYNDKLEKILKSELNKLIKKQTIEFNLFKHKKDLILKNFNNQKNNDLNVLNQKFKNQKNELINYQNKTNSK